MAGANAMIGKSNAVPFLLGGMLGAGVTLLVAAKRKPRPGPVKRVAFGAREQFSAAVGKVKTAVKRG